jgi:hypothetical protein
MRGREEQPRENYTQKGRTIVLGFMVEKGYRDTARSWAAARADYAGRSRCACPGCDGGDLCWSATSAPQEYYIDRD